MPNLAQFLGILVLHGKTRVKSTIWFFGKKKTFQDVPRGPRDNHVHGNLRSLLDVREVRPSRPLLDVREVRPIVQIFKNIYHMVHFKNMFHLKIYSIYPRFPFHVTQGFRAGSLYSGKHGQIALFGGNKVFTNLTILEKTRYFRKNEGWRIHWKAHYTRENTGKSRSRGETKFLRKITCSIWPCWTLGVSISSVKHGVFCMHTREYLGFSGFCVILGPFWGPFGGPKRPQDAPRRGILEHLEQLQLQGLRFSWCAES